MNIDFAFFWKLFVRRLPVMALFMLACTTLGIIAASKLPDTWSTSARLLVEAPQIPDEMVASTIRTGAVEQLDILQQKLLTRSKLINIANRFDVFEDLRKMEPDVVVKKMRSATQITRSAGRNQATLMTISFEARSPQIAAGVVNEYATLTLEESLDIRISSAEDTATFFEQEVNRLNAELNQQSVAIATFKSENSSALPEDQTIRLGRLTLLQDRLARLEQDLAATEIQRAEIVRIYQATGQISAAGDQRNLSREQQQLNAALINLDQALATYSERHPQVIRLKARIVQLEEIVATQSQTGQTSNDEVPPTAESALLEANLSQIDNRLVSLKADTARTLAELEALENNISRSSANGIQLASFEREYEIIQTRYNAAVNNMNAARMSERIETTAQGERISIIENASVPQVPTGPNRPKIVILGIAAGIALAGGYFMLLELLNRTIRRPVELSSRFNVVPIATVPYMESSQRRFVRRTSLIGATLIVLVCVPLGLWYIDTNYLPLEIIVQKGLSKLGLS